MKLIGKFVAKKIASLIVLSLLLAGGFWYLNNKWLHFFDGTLTSKYEFVIKRFERESQLIVAGADVDTKSTQIFTNDNFKDWPKWTEPITKAFIGRDLVVEIPTKTEFKLELKNLTKDDVELKNNVLSFKQPLTVYVDSQAVDVPVIKKNSSGLVDKAVDLVTSSQKAQEFLAEKSQEAMYETSEHVLDDEERQEKVAAFANDSLENLLNLNSEEKLEVELTVDDLNFVIEDKKK